MIIARQAGGKSGCKEAVDAGKSGLLFEPEDVSSLTASVEKILSLDESSRRDMGALGRRFIERSFDRNIIIGKYKDILNRIID